MKTFIVFALCFACGWIGYVFGAVQQNEIDTKWIDTAWNRRGFIGCEDGSMVVRDINFNIPGGMPIPILNWDGGGCTAGQE